MTLDEYKAAIDSRLKNLRESVDMDVEAAKRGIACGERLNLAAYAIAVYQMVRAELDEIDWIQL